MYAERSLRVRISKQEKSSDSANETDRDNRIDLGNGQMDNATEMIKQIIQIERKHEMHSKSVLEVNYWIFLRRWIIVDLKSEKHHQSNTDIKGKVSGAGKLKIGLELLRNSYFRHYKAPKETRAMIFSHPRRVFRDGVYECTYTSLLAEAFPGSLMLERPDPYQHLSPIPEKHIIYVDRSIVESNISYKWNTLFCKKKKRQAIAEILNQIGPVIEEINETFHVSLSKQHYADSVYRHVILYRSKRRYYEKLVRKYKPKVIMEVVSYLPECLILSELGKKYKIPTVELQHGIIDETHPAYHFGPDIKLPQLPDYIFVFSDYWKELVPSPFTDKQIKVTGYPYFERDVRKYKERMEKERESGQEEIRICFISQWTIGAALSKLALELEDKLRETGKSYKIFYKLHPGEFKDWKEKYPRLAESSIEVVGQGDMSLYEMFAGCQIQIGVASTAIFEGLGFGLKTLIYRISDAEMFQQVCDKGYASYINGVEDILKEMQLDHSKKQEQSFWKMNSLETMKEELETIIRESNDGIQPQKM